MPSASATARRREGLGRAPIAGSLRRLRVGGIVRIGAEIDPENAASLGLFHACGVTVAGEARDAAGPCLILTAPQNRSSAVTMRPSTATSSPVTSRAPSDTPPVKSGS